MLLQNQFKREDIMNKRKILILALIFTVSALIGSQTRTQTKSLKSKPASSPNTRTEYVQSNNIKHQATSKKDLTEVEKLDNSIQKLSQSMPSKEEMKKLGEQAIHHLPASIAELSEDLGAIKQILHDNPNDGIIIGKAIAFYRTCSLQTSWSTSIRALCLANLHEVAGESLDSAPVELYRLAKLAVELPES